MIATVAKLIASVLFAVSLATRPSMIPVPKSSGCFDCFFATE